MAADPGVEVLEAVEEADSEVLEAVEEAAVAPAEDFKSMEGHPA